MRVALVGGDADGRQLELPSLLPTISVPSSWVFRLAERDVPADAPVAIEYILVHRYGPEPGYVDALYAPAERPRKRAISTTTSIGSGGSQRLAQSSPSASVLADLIRRGPDGWPGS